MPKNQLSKKNIPSGTIMINCSICKLQEKEWIKIVIQDNGKGIENIKKVLDKYSDKPPREGLKRGQGLFLARIAIDELEGEIIPENNQNGGAKFTIFLPKSNNKS